MTRHNEKVRSTHDITLYGLPVPTQLEDEIWYGRASRQQTLKDYLGTATSEEKKEFFEHFCILQDMLLSYLSESERLLLLLDNSTIQDILQQSENIKRKPRHNSLLALLIEAEDHHLIDLFPAITPVILYEANGCRQIQDECEWKAIRSRLTVAMASIGLDITYAGFRDFKQLRQAHQDIVEDEAQIRLVLEKIRKQNWLLDPSTSYLGKPIALALAEDNVPDIPLRYFDVAEVKRLLMYSIERAIAEANGQDAPIVTILAADRAPAVLKLKGGNVAGLGDIELLSECALVAQASRKHPWLNMAVSADDALNRMLFARTDTIVVGPSYIGGTDPTRMTTASQYMWRREKKKVNKTNARAVEHRKEARAFISEHLEEFVR